MTNNVVVMFTAVFEQVDLELPAIIVHRGRMYKLEMTARNGLVLNGVVNKSLDLPIVHSIIGADRVTLRGAQLPVAQPGLVNTTDHPGLSFVRSERHG